MVKIIVTAEDIQKGVRYTPSHCPIAHAVSRQTGQYAGVNLKFVTLYDEDGDIAGQWQTPSDAADWLSAFDRGEKVQPAGFDLTKRTNYPRIE